MSTSLPATCTFAGCTLTSRARGMCINHYQHWYWIEGGWRIARAYVSRDATPLERLQVGSVTDPVTGCTEWQLGTTEFGYGRLRIGKRRPLCHVLGWELEFGPTPKGLVLDHICENRICWNTRHLEPVTQRLNTLRGRDSIGAMHLAKSTPTCVCWDRSAPECPNHGQLHWRDDWRECVASGAIALAARQSSAAA